MSLRDALLKAAAGQNLPRETVQVPELADFGITQVIVQGMSGAQRDAWEASLVIRRGKRQDLNTVNVRARLAVQCLINEDGSRTFSDGDADALGALRVDVLGRVFEVAQRLSGVSDRDIDELGKSSAPADSSASLTS